MEASVTHPFFVLLLLQRVLLVYSMFRRKYSLFFMMRQVMVGRTSPGTLEPPAGFQIWSHHRLFAPWFFLLRVSGTPRHSPSLRHLQSVRPGGGRIPLRLHRPWPRLFPPSVLLLFFFLLFFFSFLFFSFFYFFPRHSHFFFCCIRFQRKEEW